MSFKRNTALMVFVLCSLVLWCKLASAGSSFLSPTQKPPRKGSPIRAGRQAMEEFTDKGNYITIKAPFDMGVTMTEGEYETYGVTLQNILQRVLGNSETAE